MHFECGDRMVLQDWKTERYKEIIKSGTVRTCYYNHVLLR